MLTSSKAGGQFPPQGGLDPVTALAVSLDHVAAATMVVEEGVDASEPTATVTPPKSCCPIVLSLVQHLQVRVEAWHSTMEMSAAVTGHGTALCNPASVTVATTAVTVSTCVGRTLAGTMDRAPTLEHACVMRAMLVRHASTVAVARHSAATTDLAPNVVTVSAMGVTTAATAIRCATDKGSVPLDSVSVIPATWVSSVNQNAMDMAPVPAQLMA